MRYLALGATVALLTACGGGGGGGGGAAAVQTPPPPAPTPARFEVTAVNLTAAQPLSPIAVMVHDDSFSAFSIGQPASIALETLAEGGDNSELLATAGALADTSGEGPLGPGASETLAVELPDDNTADMRVTVVSMLVNTNDAITAVNAVDVSGLAVGESMVVSGRSYDTGTEANDELGANIPGPAGGGEGFNEVRDDLRDQVTLHPGVVGFDGGLGTSDLSELHRWDHPVARFTITRTE